jgi:hypothetical protein
MAKYGKCKAGKVVANHVFPVSNVGIFLPMTSRYCATLFTSSIVKCYGDVATVMSTWQHRIFTPSFGGEVKPSVPCRRFAAC